MMWIEEGKGWIIEENERMARDRGFSLYEKMRLLNIFVRELRVFPLNVCWPYL